jgi:hypothetical protein
MPVILATQGGGGQEDHGSKPAQANSSQPCLEKTHHKNRAGGVAQGTAPEFKPQCSFYLQKNFCLIFFFIISVY